MISRRIEVIVRLGLFVAATCCGQASAGWPLPIELRGLPPVTLTAAVAMDVQAKELNQLESALVKAGTQQLERGGVKVGSDTPLSLGLTIGPSSTYDSALCQLVIVKLSLVEPGTVKRKGGSQTVTATTWSRQTVCRLENWQPCVKEKATSLLRSFVESQQLAERTASE